MNCLLISIFCLFVSIVYTCDIVATLQSQTAHQVFAQFTFFNDTKSPVYEFSKNGKEHKVRIKGLICNLKPTKLDVYEKDPRKGVNIKPKGTSSAFLEGYGAVNYIILKHSVFMGAKFGISCAAGDCGSARG